MSIDLLRLLGLLNTVKNSSKSNEFEIPGNILQNALIHLETLQGDLLRLLGLLAEAAVERLEALRERVLALLALLDAAVLEHQALLEVELVLLQLAPLLLDLQGGNRPQKPPCPSLRGSKLR